MGVIKISELYFYIRDLLGGTYTLRILESYWELLIKIAPYFVASILIQVVMIQIIGKKRFSLNFDNKILAIIGAALLGMISPLPTYAAVPVALSFLPLGIPVGAVISFVIASPLINPGVFFLTLTQLGVEIAIARIIATFVIAVGGGILAGYLFKYFKIPDVSSVRIKPRRSFFQEFWKNFQWLGKYFALALLISACVKALISPQLVSEILGKHIQGSLLIAISLGVPFYSCGGAAIPFVEVLSDLGMNKGAVLAFFIAGPATKLETLYIFKSMMGIKVFVYYLVLTVIGAYLAGLFLMFYR
jgi:uncharacterized membrane protein YraQ (UPF0718 family)